jgi:hypothetical protein
MYYSFSFRVCYFKDERIQRVCNILSVLEYVSNDKRALVGNLSLALWLTLGGVYQPWLLKWLGEWKTFLIILFSQTSLIFCAPL